MPLSPSQRINLLKEIAHRLSSEDWPLVVATLKQYGLPYLDQWSGTKDSYILHNAADATDKVLIDLADHLGFHFEKSASAIPSPSCWKDGMFRVFISHLAVERAFAADLQKELCRYGIYCFVAHKDIEPTKAWQDEIEAALQTCDALIALLHPNFHASNWTDQEIGYAMGRGIPTFAVRFGQDPYGFLARFQAFNGLGKQVGELAGELFGALMKHPSTRCQIAESLVNLFELSGSFAQSKERIGYLEQVEYLDSHLASRIQLAAKENFQIKDSWGVGQRVQRLVAKWLPQDASNPYVAESM